jgi:hypothetical protein
MTATLAGRGVPVGVDTLSAASFVVVGIGVSVGGRAVGKGVIGTVGVGGSGLSAVDVGDIVVGIGVHPPIKITNKVKIEKLVKFNGINRPFVTLRIVFLMLEYRPKIIVENRALGFSSYRIYNATACPEDP